MNLTIEQVNDVLSDLSKHSLQRKYSLVLEQEPGDYYEEKYDGNESKKTEIYKLGIDDLHLKLERQTDSYGDNESLVSIKFVRPIVKQVTDFE